MDPGSFDSFSALETDVIIDDFLKGGNIGRLEYEK
jgi:hypothetical protein